MTTAPSFDDLVELQKPEEAPEAVAETPTEATEETPSEWPKSVDEAPEGAKTVQEFADHIKALLVEKLVGEGVSLYDAIAQNSRVNTNSVYQYTRRDKNPMPSFLVRTTNEDGTPGDPKIFIPTDEATEWWMNRPERGAGSTLAADDVEKLLVKAGKKASQVADLEARLARVTAALEKQTKLRDRYGERLQENGKTWEEANAAFQATVEAEADEESAKSEISDDE